MIPSLIILTLILGISKASFYIRVEPDATTNEVVNLIESDFGFVDRIMRNGSIIGAFLLSIDADSLNALESDPRVQSVEPVPQFEPLQVEINDTIPDGIDLINAEGVWNFGQNRRNNIGSEFATFGNEEVVVCVIDQGLNPDHEDFQGLNIVNTNPVEEWRSPANFNHGNHLTGIISAQLNSVGIVGIAPNVSIGVVKVFQDFGEVVAFDYFGGLIGAVEDCEQMGAKVILMGLGSITPTEAEREAFADSPALLIAAAGNDGSEILYFPASYSNVLSVGAIDESSQLSSFTQRNPLVDLVAPGVSVLSTVEDGSPGTLTIFDDSDPQTYPVSRLGGSFFDSIFGSIFNTRGTCSIDDLNQLDPAPSGGICHCYATDTIPLSEQVTNAVSAGCFSVIITNDPGQGLITGTVPDQFWPPAGANGDARQGLDSLPNGVQVEMDFNVRFPVSSYSRLSGTSQASAHVAGVAALLFSAVPDASPDEVKRCLMTTTLDLGPTPGFGNGLVQADSAYLCALKILRRRLRNQFLSQNSN